MAKGPIDWNTAAWLKIRWNYENQHYEFHSLPDCNDFICADLFFVRRGNHNEPIDEFTNIYTFSNLLTPGSPTKQRMNFWDWSMFSQYPWCVDGTISTSLAPGSFTEEPSGPIPRCATEAVDSFRAVMKRRRPWWIFRVEGAEGAMDSLKFLHETLEREIQNILCGNSEQCGMVFDGFCMFL